ncbi:FmdE family protein [Methanosarcina sp. WH1]|uniref:FmdE family protein n=1 Tax=Methanosarcina sp. WH1 TaxID=1434102 RepID=UPI000615B860|nr:FmdE family protein [Methanosarcina sp. WH1]AKB20313.1 FmdE, Molybdenum formylmethanofuran dehydrogenase operon [Methanosarcina sp. WH1]
MIKMAGECSHENTGVNQIALFSEVSKFHGHVCPGLTYRDYGKQAFTFICRGGGKAVRFVLKSEFNIENLDPELSEFCPRVMSGTATEAETLDFGTQMNCVSEYMREMPAEEIFDIKHVNVEIPRKARIFNSVKCSKCGEMFAESRARMENGEIFCTSCYEEYTRGW